MNASLHTIGRLTSFLRTKPSGGALPQRDQRSGAAAATGVAHQRSGAEQPAAGVMGGPPRAWSWGNGFLELRGDRLGW